MNAQLANKLPFFFTWDLTETHETLGNFPGECRK